MHAYEIQNTSRRFQTRRATVSETPGDHEHVPRNDRSIAPLRRPRGAVHIEFVETLDPQPGAEERRKERGERQVAPPTRELRPVVEPLPSKDSTSSP